MLLVHIQVHISRIPEVAALVARATHRIAAGPATRDPVKNFRSHKTALARPPALHTSYIKVPPPNKQGACFVVLGRSTVDTEIKGS